jgi:hypothetical protein
VAASPTPTPTSTPTLNPVPFKLTSPEVASVHLFDAWKVGSRAAALQFASTTAVNTLFAHPFSAPGPAFQTCTHVVDHFICNYTFQGGAMNFLVTGGVSAGYRVSSVSFVAD